ncbi:MAG TPA: glycosyltransferase family A protein [Acidimicrobiales bacterium]|nr:glycosyltransferase family A protein [Acidimicrobiales bacterium]
MLAGKTLPSSQADGGEEPQVLPVVVVIATYQRQALLARALRSVACQTVRPAQVLVVDDGSRDGTAELARSFGVEVIEKARNEGLSAARDDGIQAARPGTIWVALLDDDDEWLPHHLSTLWSWRGAHVLVSGTAAVLGPSVSTHGASSLRGEVVRSPARLLFPENSVTTSAAMVRRDVLTDVGGFDKSLRYAEDLDAWLRVLERGTAILVPEITCLYHQHGGQLSSNRDAMRAANTQIMNKYESRSWISPRLRQRVAVVDTWDHLQACRAARDWDHAWSDGAWLARPSRLADLSRLWAFRRKTRRFSLDHGWPPGHGDEGPHERAQPASVNPQ